MLRLSPDIGPIRNKHEIANGGQLLFIFIKNLPKKFPVWPRGYREDLIYQPIRKKKSSMSVVVLPDLDEIRKLQKAYPEMLHVKYCSIWPSSSEENIY